MRKNLLSMLAVAAVALFAASCSNEEPSAAIEQNPVNEDVVIADNVVVLSHENGLTAPDVNIVSADSATISVNNGYLNREGVTLSKGDAVCIWRAVDELPFVRIVDNVTNDGANTTITSHAGTVADLIKDGELTMSCENYVNPNAEADARYVSDDNTYHPAVVILDGEESAYATAEEIASRAFEIDRTFQLYDKTIAVNKTFATKNGELMFRINSGYVRPQFDLDFYLRIESFKIQDFHAYAIGRLDVSLPMTFTIDVEKQYDVENTLIDKEFVIDKELFNSPKLSFIFKIGVVPVTITVNAGIDLKAHFDAAAHLEASLPFRYNGELTIGPKYNASAGWSLYRDFKQTRSSVLKDLKVDGEAHANADAAIYARLKASVYGSVGPQVKVGPHITAGILVEGSYTDQYLQVQSKGVFAIEGSAGAGIEILGYNLKDWNKDFTIYKTNLWNWTKSLPAGETSL